jgi:very-short-patch-repair endonuclease
MKSIYNHPRLKNKRRQLRQNQTVAEHKLWSYLRNRQCFGLKFFRQYGIGSYILDFYCPQIRLAIEIDGSQHLLPKHLSHDKLRTKYLNNQNIRLIRFWNNEVMNNIDGVYTKIIEVIKSTNNNHS